MHSFTISSGTDYVLCDRASLDETSDLSLHVQQPVAGPALGAAVFFVRAPGLRVVQLAMGWVLIEEDDLYAPRGEQRAGIERLVTADNIGERERVASIEVRSGWLALVPTVSSTDPSWHSLEGVGDEGCTFSAAAGLYDLWWMTTVDARCERTDVELDEYWLLLPSTSS